MINNPKVSVIIPVYNVEKYLRECLDSVVNQTLKDIEIICVNDGSTDNSLQILEIYAAKDNRIKVITQENMGVSVARNSGLDIATGEYIIFVDSDDWSDLSLCKKILDNSEKTHADIICYAYNAVQDNKFVYSNLKNINKLCEKQDSLKRIIGNQVFVWDKAFKRKFLIDTGVKFVEGLKCAEDLVFCLTLFYKNPHYAYINESLYYYNEKRLGSATNNNYNAIKNDYDSFKTLVESELFKKQNLKTKKITINHFIGGSISYYKEFRNSKYKDKILKDIKEFLKYVENVIPKYQCRRLKNYKKLKKIIWKSEKHWYFNIFNIETYELNKIVTILGHKIKIARRKKNAEG